MILFSDSSYEEKNVSTYTRVHTVIYGIKQFFNTIQQKQAAIKEIFYTVYILYVILLFKILLIRVKDRIILNENIEQYILSN